VGCGTGRLAPAILSAGAASYAGFDHAASAIAAPRARHAGLANARFEPAAAADVALGAEVVRSLGVLDWLPDPELDAFLARHARADFLHTFSERRGDLRQRVHRSLRSLDALLRPGAVRPRYLALGDVARRLPKAKASTLS